MQNRAQMKESKCAKYILKCANEKRRYVLVLVFQHGMKSSAFIAMFDAVHTIEDVAVDSYLNIHEAIRLQ